MYWEHNRSFSFFIRIALTAFKNKLNILLQFAPQLFPWLWNLYLKTFLINLYVVLRFINWVTKFRSMFTFSSHFALFSRPLEISGQLRKWLLGSCNCVFFSRNRFCFHFTNRLGSCFLKFVISYYYWAIGHRTSCSLNGYLFGSGVPQSLVDEIELPVYLYVIKIDIRVVDKNFSKKIFCNKLLNFRS